MQHANPWWTPDRDAELRRLWGTMTVKALAAQIEVPGGARVALNRRARLKALGQWDRPAEPPRGRFECRAGDACAQRFEARELRDEHERREHAYHVPRIAVEPAPLVRPAAEPRLLERRPQRLERSAPRPPEAPVPDERFLSAVEVVVGAPFAPALLRLLGVSGHPVDARHWRVRLEAVLGEGERA